MRKLILLLAAAVAFSMTAFAQESSTQSSTQSTTGGGTETTTTTTTKHKHAKGEASHAQNESAEAAGSSSSSKAGEASAKEQQLSGCIAKDASGSKYVLTNARHKQGVELNSSEDLSAHVGHKVKLMGSWQKPTEEAAGGAGAKGHQMRTFNITSVKHVSDTCSAAAASKKSKSGEKTESSKGPGL